MKIVAKADTPQEVIDMIKEMFPEGMDGSPTEVVIMNADELIKAEESGELKNLTRLRGPDDLKKLLDKSGADASMGLLAGLVSRGINVKTVPYNGVDGDSCYCEACNLRRLLRGVDEDLDEGREVKDEDRAALRKVKAERAQEKAMLDAITIEPDSPEFDALPEEEQNKIKLKSFIMIEEKLQEKGQEYLDALMKAEGLTRILAMMMRARIAGNKPSTMAQLSEQFIMKILGAAFEQLGMPSGEDKE